MVVLTPLATVEMQPADVLTVEEERVEAEAAAAGEKAAVAEEEACWVLAAASVAPPPSIPVARRGSRSAHCPLDARSHVTVSVHHSSQ